MRLVVPASPRARPGRCRGARGRQRDAAASSSSSAQDDRHDVVAVDEVHGAAAFARPAIMRSGQGQRKKKPPRVSDLPDRGNGYTVRLSLRPPQCSSAEGLRRAVSAMWLPLTDCRCPSRRARCSDSLARTAQERPPRCAASWASPSPTPAPSRGRAGRSTREARQRVRLPARGTRPLPGHEDRRAARLLRAPLRRAMAHKAAENAAQVARTARAG